MKNMFACCMKPSTPVAVPFSSMESELVDEPIRPITFSLEEIRMTSLGWHWEDGLGREWHWGNVLGRGRTCLVFEGVLKNTKEVVAIKRLRIDPTMYQRFYREFKAEKSFLLKLHHENIIELKGFCTEMKEMILVLEYAPKGTLYDCLHDYLERLEWKNRMKIALGAARAMEYIHHMDPRPIVHRDIKSTHILIDDKYNAKLIDFGNAMYEPQNMQHNHIIGTEPYIAPEYKLDNSLSTKCDIHAFGVVLLELITGQKPSRQGEMPITDWARARLRDTMNWDVIVPGMVDERISETIAHNDMIELMKLAMDCLRREFSERPDAAQVVARLLELSCLEDAASCSSGGMLCLEYSTTDQHITTNELGENTMEISHGYET